MEEQTICQWCLTEIIWDEEIGPETHCPHCDNELGGYRTMQIGIETDEDQLDSHEEESDEWLDDEEGLDESHRDRMMDDSEGFRSSNLQRMAAESTVQRIIDEQEEAPECPVCREYMLEAGTQSIGAEQFKPAVPAAIGHPLVTTPFQIQWYICPACSHVSSMLSKSSQEEMIARLTPKD